jgi:phenylpyruvate tautomerase PptA (4-oxalocrotonate tautomerase family)
MVTVLQEVKSSVLHVPQMLSSAEPTHSPVPHWSPDVQGCPAAFLHTPPMHSMFAPHWQVKVHPSPRPLGAVQMLLQHLPEVAVELAHEVKSTTPVQVRHVPATHWPTAHSPAVVHACPAFFLQRLSLHV